MLNNIDVHNDFQLYNSDGFNKVQKTHIKLDPNWRINRNIKCNELKMITGGSHNWIEK